MPCWASSVHPLQTGCALWLLAQTVNSISSHQLGVSGMLIHRYRALINVLSAHLCLPQLLFHVKNVKKRPYHKSVSVCVCVCVCAAFDC